MVLSLLALLPFPEVLAGQSGAASLAVEPRSGMVELVLGDLLDEPRFREALLEGLPLRVRVVTELWRDRFFDSQEGRAEWRATVLHDPLDGTYRIRASSGEAEIALSSLEEIRLVLQRTFTVPLRPTDEGRYYYLATLDVETISLSDLEELQRWLRGDLATGIAGGRGGVEGAVTRGLGRVLQRALRLPALRVRLQSPAFEIRPDEQAADGPAVPTPVGTAS
jgi:hypothetical protein